jgi:hypothetical protein
MKVAIFLDDWHIERLSAWLKLVLDPWFLPAIKEWHSNHYRFKYCQHRYGYEPVPDFAFYPLSSYWWKQLFTKLRSCR